MLFKSALLTTASGSIGGMTASHNKAGLYLRARTIPVDPGSTRQQQIRSHMQAASIAWFEALTLPERIAWETYATQVPLIGRLGDPIYITGMQHYIRSRLGMAYFDFTPVVVAPEIFLLATFTPVAVACSEAAGNLSISFNEDDDWVNEDDAAMTVTISRPMNPTINYFKGPFRKGGTIDGSLATPLTTPQTVLLPFPAMEGQKLYAFIRAFRADGRLSTAQIANCTVTA